MELKTLKYLNQGKGGEFTDEDGTHVFSDGKVEIKELRQEAIKWFKLSDYDLYELGFDKSDNSDDLRKWIKDFFNITDEELK